jgi:hypothetical protein
VFVCIWYLKRASESTESASIVFCTCVRSSVRVDLGVVNCMLRLKYGKKLSKVYRQHLPATTSINNCHHQVYKTHILERADSCSLLSHEVPFRNIHWAKSLGLTCPCLPSAKTFPSRVSSHNRIRCWIRSSVESPTNRRQTLLRPFTLIRLNPWIPRAGSTGHINKCDIPSWRREENRSSNLIQIPRFNNSNRNNFVSSKPFGGGEACSTVSENNVVEGLLGTECACVKAWRGWWINMVYIGVYLKEWWCPKGGEIAIYRPMCGQCVARDSLRGLRGSH